MDWSHYIGGKDPDNFHRLQGTSFELIKAGSTEDKNVPCLLVHQMLLLCEGSGGEEKPHIRVNDHSAALLINATDPHVVRKGNLKGSTPAEK